MRRHDGSVLDTTMNDSFYRCDNSFHFGFAQVRIDGDRETARITVVRMGKVCSVVPIFPHVVRMAMQRNEVYARADAEGPQFLDKLVAIESQAFWPQAQDEQVPGMLYFVRTGWQIQFFYL